MKNGKVHDVPLSESLAPVLAEHIRRFPRSAVTLPWRVPGGDPVTCTLLLTRPCGLAMHRNRANKDWRAALLKAGLIAARKPGEPKRRPEPGNGMRVLRHTAASAWLSAGVGVPAVAA